MKTRGFEFELMPVRDSYMRRSVQMTNKIKAALGQIGVLIDDVDVTEENPLSVAAASVSWYIDGHHCHFSHSQQTRFIDNLQVVLKIIELEVSLVISEKKSVQQLIYDYSEETDFAKERQKAREILQIPADCKEMEMVDSQYRKLSKQAHPDMPEGNTEKFKEINRAHKTLKRELE